MLEGPSPASDGRLAYVHVNGRIGSVTPYGGQLWEGVMAWARSASDALVQARDTEATTDG